MLLLKEKLVSLQRGGRENDRTSSKTMSNLMMDPL